MNLTDTELKNEQKSLLNLGPNFFSATRKNSFMDIILATETCVTDLENNSKEIDIECLCQNISHMSHFQ